MLGSSVYLIIRDVYLVDFFFLLIDTAVLVQRLELLQRRSLCIGIENGRHSKKRSKVGNICFIRRISSVSFTFCDITEVIHMT